MCFIGVDVNLIQLITLLSIKVHSFNLNSDNEIFQSRWLHVNAIINSRLLIDRLSRKRQKLQILFFNIIDLDIYKSLNLYFVFALFIIFTMFFVATARKQDEQDVNFFTLSFINTGTFIISR